VYDVCMRFWSQTTTWRKLNSLFLLDKLVHPTGFEPVTSAFGEHGFTVRMAVFCAVSRVQCPQIAAFDGGSADVMWMLAINPLPALHH
jgi:hypothetical protein